MIYISVSAKVVSRVSETIVEHRFAAFLQDAEITSFD